MQKQVSAQSPPAVGWGPSWVQLGMCQQQKATEQELWLSGQEGGGCPRGAQLGQDKSCGNPGVLLANAEAGGTRTG